MKQFVEVRSDEDYLDNLIFRMGGPSHAPARGSTLRGRGVAGNGGKPLGVKRAGVKS